MNKLSLQFIFSVILTLSTFQANAQFSNLLRDLKSTAESITKPLQAPKQEPFVPGSPKETVQQPATTAVTPPVTKGPPKPDPEIAFQCKVNGKEIIYRNNFASDDPNINITLDHIHSKRLMQDYDYRTTSKEPLYVNEETGQRVSVTTVYFKDKQMTYGISFCQGMMCGNPNQPYSFTVFNGEKKVQQDFCDEDSASEFKFPIKTDSNGKLMTTMKDVIVIKKTNLKFNPFN
jgi:hypothetical protein